MTVSVETLWTGAVTSDGVTVVARLNRDHASVRLAATAVSGGAVTYGTPAATVDNHAKLTIAGLTAAGEYTYVIEAVGHRTVGGVTGRFRTAPSGAGSYTVAFAGDASELSNATVFDSIRAKDPLLFIHLGDMHYNNLAVNNVANYRAVYDEVFAQARQSLLYRSYPTAYVWDDHDYGVNNADTNSVSKVAAAAAYRARVPHYPLEVSDAIYHSFDIGRVRYIVTDQRYFATPNASTDNSSKSMLGATQKTWFKNLLSNSSGKMIVWICTRAFGGVATVGADHWGGFTTERTEIGAHIHANCPGRVVVISADAHAAGIDSGANHAYGSEPLKCFQAAPLDRTVDATQYGAAVYSEGWFNDLGAFGTMNITDTGGATIGVVWHSFIDGGTQRMQYSFTVTP